MAVTLPVPDIPVDARVAVDPRRTALAVIDMQHDFVSDGGSLQVPDAAAPVPAIARLLALARGSGMRVVFSQDTHGAGDPEFAIWPEHAVEGSWGWGIVDAL